MLKQKNDYFILRLRGERMCGRFYIDMEIEEAVKAYNYLQVQNKNIFMKKGDIFPADVVPVITQDKEFRMMKWGYSAGRMIINAKAETIMEKPLFKKSVYRKRCIIPANSFYEWKGEKGNKKKFRISIRDAELFSMAGLYDTFIDNDGKEYEAFVVITTAANKEMSDIHDRMPVILKKGEESLWLETRDKGILEKLMKPYEDGGLSLVDITEASQLSFL